MTVSLWKRRNIMMSITRLHLENVSSSEGVLIVGYSALITASNQITHDELLAIRSDEVEEKLAENPLADTLETLGRILTDRSLVSVAREAVERQKAKDAKKSQISQIPNPSKTITVSKPDASDPSSPRQSSTLPSTSQKRNISDTSFGTRSTETTPTKLIKPETDIQHLQDILVANILRVLYGKLHVKVTWPRG